MKLASPTNTSESPKASCWYNEPCSDWMLGQTKKTMVIASCGTSSAVGTSTPGKVTRLSCIARPAAKAGGLAARLKRSRAVRLLELTQQVVAAADRTVEG